MTVENVRNQVTLRRSRVTLEEKKQDVPQIPALYLCLHEQIAPKIVAWLACIQFGGSGYETFLC